MLKLVVTGVTLACATVSALTAIWAAWEAQHANNLSQKGSSSAVITSPVVGSSGCAPVTAGGALSLRGTAHLAVGRKLWEITQGSDNSLWPGPTATLNPVGSTWQLRIPNIGGPTDKGHTYSLLLLSADPNSAQVLQAEAVAAHYQSIRQIPQGTQLLRNLCVVLT